MPIAQEKQVAYRKLTGVTVPIVKVEFEKVGVVKDLKGKSLAEAGGFVDKIGTGAIPQGIAIVGRPYNSLSNYLDGLDFIIGDGVVWGNGLDPDLEYRYQEMKKLKALRNVMGTYSAADDYRAIFSYSKNDQKMLGGN
ncbi:hypothetical protein D3C84_944820 [compost metagenome]